MPPDDACAAAPGGLTPPVVPIIRYGFDLNDLAAPMWVYLQDFYGLGPSLPGMRSRWWDRLANATRPEDKFLCQQMIDKLGEAIGLRAATVKQKAAYRAEADAWRAAQPAPVPLGLRRWMGQRSGAQATPDLEPTVGRRFVRDDAASGE